MFDRCSQSLLHTNHFLKDVLDIVCFKVVLLSKNGEKQLLKLQKWLFSNLIAVRAVKLLYPKERFTFYLNLLRKFFPFIPNAVPEDLKYGIKTINEEMANMLSHGFGLVCFLTASPFLIFRAVHADIDGYTLGSLVFCFSLLLVYTSSTLYHSVYKVKLKRALRTFDHMSIYFLIAGSFIPFLLVKIDPSTSSWVLKIQWAMVAIGVIFKLFFTHKFKIISVLAYVGMGALSLFVIEPLSIDLPQLSFLFLKIGLISYSMGVFFYLWTKLPYNHLIWHLFVLIGSLSHFLAVWHIA